MRKSLQAESERLARSWMQHDSAWVRDYLIRGVEDPRLNLQSIFSRHFALRALFGDQFLELMEQECRFSAVMNWLVDLARDATDPAEFGSILNALRRGVDNAEGISLPRFVVLSFASLRA